MHTSAYRSCRIHHNSGFDGDVTITNEDSTSIPIGKKASISYSTEGLISAFKIHQRSMSGMDSRHKTVIIESNLKEGYDSEIEITFIDIQSFVEDVLTSKIEEELESSEIPYKDLEKIAHILKIKPT